MPNGDECVFKTVAEHRVSQKSAKIVSVGSFDENHLSYYLLPETFPEQLSTKRINCLNLIEWEK